MAENSEHSASSGKKPTKKTEPLTREEALGILSRAIVECRLAGLTVAPDEMYAGGRRVTIIVLDGVGLFEDGGGVRFVLANDGKNAGNDAGK